MKSPGIEVRPIKDMAGGEFFNEVFFNNVRVPAKHMVGEENRGWYIATTTLDNERSSIGSTTGLMQIVQRIVEVARDPEFTHISTLSRNPLLRMELADRMIETAMAKMLSYRVITMQNAGLTPNYEASMVKLYVTELKQRIATT